MREKEHRRKEGETSLQEKKSTQPTQSDLTLMPETGRNKEGRGKCGEETRMRRAEGGLARPKSKDQWKAAVRERDKLTQQPRSKLVVLFPCVQ